MSRVDASIPLQARSFQLPDPLEQHARFMQLQTMQQAADERVRAENERTQAQQIYADRSATPDDIERRLLGISPAQSYAYSKNRRENDKLINDTRKAKAGAEKDEFETEIKKLEYGAQLLKSANDQRSWTYMRDEFVRLRGDAKAPDGSSLADRIPLQFDPETRDLMGRTTMTKMQELQDLRAQQTNAQTVVRDTNTARHQSVTEVETARNNREQNTISRGNLGVAGGNLQVSRDRLNFDMANPPMHAIDTAQGPMLYDARGRTPTRPLLDAQGKPLPPKQPDSVRKEVLDIDAQFNAIDGALRAVTETPSAFGVMRGMATKAGDITEAIANRRASNDEIQARSFVFNNVSKIINERAGAAQSKQELARLRGFLPADLDNDTVIAAKLSGFKQYLTERRSAYAPQAQSGPPRNSALEDALRAYPE